MKESRLPVTVQIGQHGLSDAVVTELRDQVRRRKVVKAKRLASSFDERSEKEFWQDLAKRAGVRLVEVRGHTAVLADPRYGTQKEEMRRAQAQSTKKPPRTLI